MATSIYEGQQKPVDKPVLVKRTAPLVVKRTFDLLMCLLVLPIFLPVLLLISILIMLDSSGPALFKQTRIGKDGKRFTIFKFRTMFYKFDDSSHREFMKKYINGNVDRNNGSFKPPIDQQITRIGHILRKTSLDELPQLFNVIRGDMSLVGPRPNVEWEVDAYEDWHKERLEVMPGITGLAQVKGRSNIPFDILVKYDIEYARKQSFKLDVQILAETALAVVKRDGAG